MNTPNQMPNNNNKIRQQILSNLIETHKTSWSRTAWKMNPDTDKLEEVKVKMSRDSLRHPLAQNVSDESVERASRKFAR